MIGVFGFESNENSEGFRVFGFVLGYCLGGMKTAGSLSYFLRFVRVVLFLGRSGYESVFRGFRWTFG